MQLAYMKSGIASNRGSARRGEYVRALTARTPRRFVTPEVGGVTFRSQPPKVGWVIGVKSCMGSRIGGAAGSLPRFLGKTEAIGRHV